MTANEIVEALDSMIDTLTADGWTPIQLEPIVEAIVAISAPGRIAVQALGPFLIRRNAKMLLASMGDLDSLQISYKAPDVRVDKDFTTVVHVSRAKLENDPNTLSNAIHFTMARVIKVQTK